MNSSAITSDDFLKALNAGGLVADGATGNLLYDYGVYVNRNFDEVNLSQPELVEKIHRQYIDAGAHVIETNTYGANRIRLARHGLSHKVEDINEAAVEIACRAAGSTVFVLGAIGPTGLSASDVRRSDEGVFDAFAEQAKILSASGVHALIIETFALPTELRLAVKACKSVSSLPIIAEFQVDDEGEVSDLTPPQALAQEMVQWGADAVGVNCNGPGVIFDVVQKLLPLGIPVCAMPNAGRPQRIEDRHIYLATPENFGVYAKRLFKAGVHLVGGCCGSNPEHIRKVSAAARMVYPSRETRPAPRLGGVVEVKPSIPLAERSNLAQKVDAGTFVFSVEVNPKPGLDLDTPIAAAKMLLEAGADVINISDGPRASARMGNIALAVRMQERLGCETILHICCRDRNLMGLQAHLLSAHALGIRNTVLITGDPPKIGDFPDATAVYDLDSVGLIKMANDMNVGLDASGASTDQSRFFILTGAEPAAYDFEREVFRVEQKIQAGANAVMTQPVYEVDILNRFLDAIEHLKVPVLVGILPLASYKNAEFLHHNVPGMRVPEKVRARLAKHPKGADARAIGLEIASETLMAVRARVQGAYLMPPLGRYEMAADIIKALSPKL